MKKLKLNNKGFSAIEGLLIAIVVVLVAGIGYYVYQSGQTSNDNANQQTEQQSTDEATNEEAEAGGFREVLRRDGFRGFVCRTGSSGNNGKLRYIIKRTSGSASLIEFKVTYPIRPDSRGNDIVFASKTTQLNRYITMNKPFSAFANGRVKSHIKYRLAGNYKAASGTTIPYKNLPAC